MKPGLASSIAIGRHQILERHTVKRGAGQPAIGKFDTGQIDIPEPRACEVDVIDLPAGHVAVIEARPGEIDLIEASAR